VDLGEIEFSVLPDEDAFEIRPIQSTTGKCFMHNQIFRGAGI
jgi:hypothetical protein